MIQYALSQRNAADAGSALLAGLIVALFIVIVSLWVRVISPLMRALNRLGGYR